MTYDLSDGWGSGFVANVNITDTGPNPITGWTLALQLPGRHRVRLVQQLERQLDRDRPGRLVTPLDWDANLAANGGNTVSIGFVGNQNGAYPSPASFTLNGTVCTTTFTS